MLDYDKSERFMGGLETLPDSKAGAQLSITQAKQRFGNDIFGVVSEFIVKRQYKTDHQNIPYEDFKTLILQPCTYCGEINIKSYNGKIYPIAELDRIDSTKNYTIKNVVPACRYCNYMKGAWSKERFLKKAWKIAKNNS